MPQEYKVSNIEQTVGTDGSLWVISLQDKKVTLTVREEPTYKEGDILPFEIELVKPEKGRWYYKRRGTSTQASGSTEGTKFTAKPSWKPTKNDDAILQAVAFKGAIELEKHHYVPEGKTDTDRVLRSTRALYDGLKKMLIEEEK